LSSQGEGGDGEPRPRAAPSHGLGARARPPDAMVVGGVAAAAAAAGQWGAVACRAAVKGGGGGGARGGGKGKVAESRRWGEKVEGRVGVGLIVAVAANARLSSCRVDVCRVKLSRVEGLGGEKGGYAGAFSNNVLVFLFFLFWSSFCCYKIHLFS